MVFVMIRLIAPSHHSFTVPRNLLFAALTLCSAQQLSAATPAQIDRLTEKWLQVEQQNHALINDWKVQKPAMQQRLSLLQAEKEQLTQMLQESSAGQDDVEERRSELMAEQAELEQQQEKLTEALAQLAATTEGLSPMLPELVRNNWEKEQQAVGDQAETSVLLQGTLAKLSDLDEFNQRITTHETVMSTGTDDVLVKQIYLGAGYAWFASQGGDYAGYGRIVNHTWQWQFSDQIDGDAINRAIDVFEKRQPPQLVQLPIIIGAEEVQP